MLCDAMGMYEKEIESADLQYVADSEPTLKHIFCQ